jgi:hypothetical protein
MRESAGDQMADARICTKCQGQGIRAARLKNFVAEGQDLRCISFVSSCMTCGHCWEDEVHEAQNSHEQERARKVASCRGDSALGRYTKT